MNVWFLNNALNSAVSWNLTPPTSESTVVSAESRMTDLPPGTTPYQFSSGGHNHNSDTFCGHERCSCNPQFSFIETSRLLVTYESPCPAPPPPPSGLRRGMSCLSSKATPILDFHLISWDPCMGCLLSRHFWECAMQCALEEHKERQYQVIFFWKFEIKKVGFLPYYIKFGNRAHYLIRGFPL